MTPEQHSLYRNFHADAKGHDLRKDTFDSETNHTIALLTRMRKILNHPNLVEGRHGFEASGKFLALKQLLDDLGFVDGEKSLTAKVQVELISDHCVFEIQQYSRPHRRLAD
jgi:SNF2 family DNA or RNA helicase